MKYNEHKLDYLSPNGPPLWIRPHCLNPYLIHVFKLSKWEIDGFLFFLFIMQKHYIGFDYMSFGAKYASTIPTKR